MSFKQISDIEVKSCLQCLLWLVSACDFCHIDWKFNVILIDVNFRDNEYGLFLPIHQCTFPSSVKDKSIGKSLGWDLNSRPLHVKLAFKPPLASHVIRHLLYQCNGCGLRICFSQNSGKYWICSAFKHWLKSVVEIATSLLARDYLIYSRLLIFPVW